MKPYKKFLLRMLYIGILSVLLALPALAAQNIPTYTMGAAGLELIKDCEGFAAKKYWDYSRYSIGYGASYDKAVAKFPEIAAKGTITQAQAEQLLRDDLKAYEGYVNSFLKNNDVTVNQNQFDALVSYTYNLGPAWLRSSSSDASYVVKGMLLEGPYAWTAQRVTTAFGTYGIRAGGTVLTGLVNRRAREAKLFLTPVEDTSGQSTGSAGSGQSVSPVFSDVPTTAWFYEYVAAAYDRKLMQGYGNGLFGPDEDLTRAQMVQALSNFAGVDRDTYVVKGERFLDVPAGSWFYKAIGWARDNGIVNGYGGGLFGPEDPIQRQHLCSIIARYLRGIGITAGTSVQRFADDGKIQEVAREDVYFCASVGLVNGVGNNYFDPEGYATRAQLAKILVRMYDLVQQHTQAA